MPCHSTDWSNILWSPSSSYLHVGMVQVVRTFALNLWRCRFKSVVSKVLFCWNLSLIISVTRFGKISPLWQHLKSLEHLFQCLFCIGQIFETTFVIYSNWENFHCRKWPKIEQRILSLCWSPSSMHVNEKIWLKNCTNELACDQFDSISHLWLIGRR